MLTLKIKNPIGAPFLGLFTILNYFVIWNLNIEKTFKFQMSLKKCNYVFSIFLNLTYIIFLYTFWSNYEQKILLSIFIQNIQW